ncbi:MAG: hypothetical protein JWO95_355 [Verrucomicrobiales bacterium]|nr:hypothetical protein [Verrucomicrobiales bacterium]
MAFALLNNPPMQKLARALIALMLSAMAFSPSAQAVTLSQLKNEPNLTPDQFAHYFSDFEFKFHAEVQDHDVFLRTKSGDCDDFATLAAEVLAKKGYTPRMIAIRMKGETHVVCYIKETESYLDYNTRKDAHPLVPCAGDITVIAKKVAESFGRDWVATYEFTYEDAQKVKRLVNNIIPNKPPAQLAKENVNTAAAGTKVKGSKAPKSTN